MGGRVISASCLTGIRDCKRNGRRGCALIGRERAWVQTILMMNACRWFVFNKPPHNDALEIDLDSVIQDVRPYLQTPDALCAVALVEYFTNTSGTSAFFARSDYPELYGRMQIQFLSNKHIRNFLSVVVDAYEDDGEFECKKRLIANNAYVYCGTGKDFARKRIVNTPIRHGFWSVILRRKK